MKFLQGQPALGVVLAQAGGRRLAVGVCDARARSGSHVILRVLAESAVLLARRYISIRPWASQLVIWGDAGTIAARIGQYRRAGADHVMLHVLNDGDQPGAMEVARQLAGGLLAGRPSAAP